MLGHNFICHSPSKATLEWDMEGLQEDLQLSRGLVRLVIPNVIPCDPFRLVIHDSTKLETIASPSRFV